MARSTAQSARIPGEERVFSLVLALVASPHGLTKGQLLSSVYGYADRYRASRDTTALERQFERDKEQLRQLGLPIETFETPGAPGDNRQLRYRISKQRLELPEGVRFSSDELQMLRLAALAWRDGSLGEESRWSSMRLASLGATPDLSALGIAPRLSIVEPAAPALQRAIDETRVVRFDYRLPGRDSGLARRVAPLRLHRAERRWHLIAWDLDRESDRVFLLSRICSSVETESTRFDPALAERVPAALEALFGLAGRQRAQVGVRTGTLAEARLAQRSAGEPVAPASSSEWCALDFGTLDFHALAAELAGFGDEVAVQSPAALRDETVALLRTVLSQHTALSPEPNGGARA